MTINKLQRIRSAGESLDCRLEETMAVVTVETMEREASHEARNRVQHTGTGQRETQTI